MSGLIDISKKLGINKVGYDDYIELKNGTLGTGLKYANEPVNQVIGFQQVPQNRFVDNKSTSAGEAIVDTRTPSEIVLDGTIARQGLRDNTFDVLPVYGAGSNAIKAGLGFAGRGIKRGYRYADAGLGFKDFRNGSLAANRAIPDTARRNAMKNGVALGAGAGIAAGSGVGGSMLIKGLGLSDSASIAARAPMSIAQNVARENIASTARSQLMTGFMHKGAKLPSITNAMNRMKKAVDDALISEAKKNGRIVMRHDKDGGYMGPQIYDKESKKMIDLQTIKEPYTYVNPRTGSEKIKYKEVFVNPNTGKKVGERGSELQAGSMNSNYSGAADKYPEILKAKEALKVKEKQIKRIESKAIKRREKALSSKEPVLSPAEIKHEIERAKSKLAEAKKKPMSEPRELYDDMDRFIGFSKDTVPITQNIKKVEKYKNRISSLESQLDNLSKTGRYANVK